MTFDKKFALRYFLQVLLSTVFLVSGWLKLSPIEPFELTLVDSGLVPWSLAPYAALLLFALEVIIAFGLVFFLKHSLLLLVLPSSHPLLPFLLSSFILYFINILTY